MLSRSHPIIPAFIGEAPDWMVSEQSYNAEEVRLSASTRWSAGPFQVVSNAASSMLVLKANPHYWQKGQPYLSSLTFESTGSDNSDLSALQAGQGQYTVISTLSLVAGVKSSSSMMARKDTSDDDGPVPWH